MPSTQPNIILINADDLGYGDLGCYGSTINDSPNLDRLAAEGMRFTDFYQASAVCSPSRGAMMTGCYPKRIGFSSFEGKGVLFPGQGVGLNPDERTIARVLKDAGYATACVGKWHCGDQPAFLPTNHGFDQYFGLPYSNDMGRQMGGNGQLRKHPPLPLMRNGDVIQEQPEQEALTERYVDESVQFLRAKAKQPFFLYLAHFHVHVPHYCAPRFLKESRNGRYGGAVAAIDWSVGVLLHELKRLGIDDNTLILFTSDNGSRVANEGGSNAPLRGTKRETWEGGQRLPLIARWPKRIAAGSVCKQVCASIDFLPTFAALAGASLPAERRIDGRDVSTCFDGGALPEKPFFYYKQDDLEAVRLGRWKRHVRKEFKPFTALYDLDADIGETTDVANAHPDIVAQLDALLATCREDLGDNAAGVSGANCRPIGSVANPKPLTAYDPAHPYIVAFYDLTESG
jgi:arylsulfatase A